MNCNCPAVIDVKRLSPKEQRDLALKLKLESRLRRDLSPVFKRIVRDFANVYRATGRPINVTLYKPEFTGLLLKHYERVQKAFSGMVERDNGSKFLTRYELKQEEDDELEALILAALVAWRTQTADGQAEFITQTNDIQLQQAIDKARQDLRDNGEELTDAAVAAGAAVILAKLYNQRLERIIITETQSAAESTQLMEAQALSGAIPFALVAVPGVNAAVPRRRTFKIWRSLLDGRERPSHNSAHGQQVEVNDSFIVGPRLSRLRFPGDSGLGAPVEEVVNCRCYTEYKIR